MGGKATKFEPGNAAANNQQLVAPVDELMEALMGKNACSNKKVVQLLHGPRPDMTLNSAGLKPIHVAVLSNNLELLRTILEIPSAEVNVQTDGMSPLHMACALISLKMVMELMRHPKINVNANANSDKITPLMALLSSDQDGSNQDKAEIVWFLTHDKKCDITITDKDGWTALTYAGHYGNLPAVEILLTKEDVQKYSLDQLIHVCREALVMGHPEICHLVMKILTADQKEILRQKLEHVLSVEKTSPLVRHLVKEAYDLCDSGFIERQPAGLAYDSQNERVEVGDFVVVTKDVSKLRSLQKQVAQIRRTHLDSAEKLAGLKAVVKFIDVNQILSLDFTADENVERSKWRYLHSQAVRRIDPQGSADVGIVNASVPDAIMENNSPANHEIAVSPKEMKFIQKEFDNTISDLEDHLLRIESTMEIEPKGVEQITPNEDQCQQNNDDDVFVSGLPHLQPNSVPENPGLQIRNNELDEFSVPNVPKTSGMARLNSDRKSRKMVNIIPFNQLEIGEKIGKGGFGTVYKVRWNFSLCAAKVIHDSTTSESIDNEDGQFFKEAELHSQLSHPHIIQFLGISFNDADKLKMYYLVVMKLVDGFDLNDVIFDKKMRLSPMDKATVSRQICDAIRYLHDDALIIHKDIKPANVMIERSTKHALITDFGISKPIEELVQKYTLTACGSLPYMAPELTIESKSSKQFLNPTRMSDIWALGATLTELFTGKHIYGDKCPSMPTLFQLKIDNKLPISVTFATRPQRDFLTPTLNPVPENRPTASQLIALLKEHELYLGKHAGDTEV